MKRKYKYHYVYRITNVVTGYHYYGSKSCNEEPWENIGKKYFSNSTNKLFIQDQKNNPKDYKYKVIKLFESCREDATELEMILHKKFDVKHHPKFINRSNQTSKKFDTTGTDIGKKINNTRLNRVNSEGLNVNQQNGLKVSEKWKDDEWRRLTIKAMKKSKSNILWKETIGHQSIKKMLDKRLNPNHNSYYGKIIETIKKTKLDTVIDGENINQIAGKKCSETKLSNEWKETIGKKATEMMLETRSKNGITYKCENNPNAKTILIYDKNGLIQYELTGQFQKFCKSQNIPYYPFVESFKNGGSPIYQNKTSLAKAKKKSWEKFEGWYAIEK